MIETSPDSLQDTFFAQAEQFLADPTVMNGIEFDDTTVKLKRALLSQQADHPAIGILNQFAALIRQRDTAGIQSCLSQLHSQLD